MYTTGRPGETLKCLFLNKKKIKKKKSKEVVENGGGGEVPDELRKM